MTPNRRDGERIGREDGEGARGGSGGGEWGGGYGSLDRARACPMWVSLINRVYRVLFLALYYHPPSPSPSPSVPPTPPPHLLPPALPQDRWCTWGLWKTLQAARLFSILPYRGKIYICAVVHLLSMHLQYFARKRAVAFTCISTVADIRGRIRIRVPSHTSDPRCSICITWLLNS